MIDWERTSLKPYVEMLDRHGVELMEEVRRVKRERGTGTCIRIAFTLSRISAFTSRLGQTCRGDIQFARIPIKVVVLAWRALFRVRDRVYRHVMLLSALLCTTIALLCVVSRIRECIGLRAVLYEARPLQQAARDN